MNGENVFVQVVDDRIDTASLESRVADPDVGAHGWFIGVTRRKTSRNGVTSITQLLSYEAHRPMAVRELTKLASQAVEKFDLKHVVIVHRLGEVPVGEASVVVGCSSAHRAGTFGANEWIMEVLKRDVPIWKQETFVDGETQWVHPIETDEPTS